MTLQLIHDPFSYEARKLGSYGAEISRYSACLKRWSEFFLEQAQSIQADYEQSRHEYLLEQAAKNRKTVKRKPTNKMLRALVAAGLSETEAKEILAQ